MAEARRLLESAGVPKDWEFIVMNRATFGNTPQGEIAANQFKQFGLNVKYQALDDAFAALREAGATELILDVRYNGGGLVSVNVSDPDAYNFGDTQAELLGDVVDGSDDPGALAATVQAQGVDQAVGTVNTFGIGAISVNVSNANGVNK